MRHRGARRNELVGVTRCDVTNWKETGICLSDDVRYSEVIWTTRVFLLLDVARRSPRGSPAQALSTPTVAFVLSLCLSHSLCSLIQAIHTSSAVEWLDKERWAPHIRSDKDASLVGFKHALKKEQFSDRSRNIGAGPIVRLPVARRCSLHDNWIFRRTRNY